MAGGWKRLDTANRNKSLKSRELGRLRILGDKNPAKRLEVRKKISDKRGHRNFREGLKHSEETKKKMSLAHKGEKSYLWRGGISFMKYSLEWTNTLKRSIRERDKYVCQLCSELQKEITFSVHHIDYDKHNCNPNNLITLCNSCHTKTNSNRQFYQEYFINLLNNIQ